MTVNACDEIATLSLAMTNFINMSMGHKKSFPERRKAFQLKKNNIIGN